MAKKVQVVLDEDTYRLLETLASPRAGNRSFVVREAIRYFADREEIERALDGVLGQRNVHEAMEAGITARAEGRLVPHGQVIRGIRRQKRSR